MACMTHAFASLPSHPGCPAPFTMSPSCGTFAATVDVAKARVNSAGRSLRYPNRLKRRSMTTPWQRPDGHPSGQVLRKLRASPVTVTCWKSRDGSVSWQGSTADFAIYAENERSSGCRDGVEAGSDVLVAEAGH